MAGSGYGEFEAVHLTLVASTDTIITFSRLSGTVRVLNWDTANRVLIKHDTITSDTDSTATRIGKAPAADVPNTKWVPLYTLSIHLRSAAASEVTVENYF